MQIEPTTRNLLLFGVLKHFTEHVATVVVTGTAAAIVIEIFKAIADNNDDAILFGTIFLILIALGGEKILAIFQNGFRAILYLTGDVTLTEYRDSEIPCPPSSGYISLTRSAKMVAESEVLKCGQVPNIAMGIFIGFAMTKSPLIADRAAMTFSEIYSWYSWLYFLLVIAFTACYLRAKSSGYIAERGIVINPNRPEDTDNNDTNLNFTENWERFEPNLGDAPSDDVADNSEHGQEEQLQTERLQIALIVPKGTSKTGLLLTVNQIIDQRLSDVVEDDLKQTLDEVVTDLIRQRDKEAAENAAASAKKS